MRNAYIYGDLMKNIPSKWMRETVPETVRQIKEHLRHAIDEIDEIAAIIYEYCDELSNITDIPPPFIKRDIMVQRLSNFRVNTFMYDILELPEVKKILKTRDENSALYKLNINFLKNLHEDFT